MKSFTRLFVITLFISLAGCSRESKVAETKFLEPGVADLGEVRISEGKLTYHNVGKGRGGIITPVNIGSNIVTLMITVQRTNETGVIFTLAKTTYEMKANQSNQVPILDDLNIRLTPKTK
jgi:hypothetical protein